MWIMRRLKGVITDKTIINNKVGCKHTYVSSLWHKHDITVIINFKFNCLHPHKQGTYLRNIFKILYFFIMTANIIWYHIY